MTIYGETFDHEADLLTRWKSLKSAAGVKRLTGVRLEQWQGAGVGWEMVSNVGKSHMHQEVVWLRVNTSGDPFRLAWDAPVKPDVRRGQGGPATTTGSPPCAR